MSQPQSEGTIYVTGIALMVRWRSGKTLNHIVLRSGSFKKEISTKISPGSSHREVFNPPLVLSIQDGLSLSMQYSSLFWSRNTLSIDVGLSEANTEAREDGNGNRAYSKSHRKIKVIINISSYSVASQRSQSEIPRTTISENLDVPGDATLLPTTAEIIRICPRFRLLVMGNIGVGKSSLIQKVFGVTDVHVSDDSRGRANINQEFVAKDNGLFVLHDSLGLEAGDSKNMDEIKRFINERRNMKNLKDRLHAVWVCLPVPYAKGRLLETGIEDFLRNRKQILGNIPIVVVLTKLDLLDTSLRRGGATKDLEEVREKFLTEYCIKPLTQAGASDIQRVPVSTRKGFGLEPTIPVLVKTTISEIERYVRADPSSYTATEEKAKRSSLERDAPIFIAGMAQRASIEENVNITIALGKQRYWRNLTASLTFSSEKVKEYILVVHEEIIDAWNFNDPKMALRGDAFKMALLETHNLGVQEIQNLDVVLNSVASEAVTILAPQITSIPRAIVLAIPAVGVATLAMLCMEIHKATQTIVKRFMAYISDLVYVMKILFVLSPNGSITPEDVALALEVYRKSPYRNCVHLLIRQFEVGAAILPGKREAVMEKIEDVIRKFSITDKDVAELRSKVEAVQGSSKKAKAPAV